MVEKEDINFSRYGKEYKEVRWVQKDGKGFPDPNLCSMRKVNNS